MLTRPTETDTVIAVPEEKTTEVFLMAIVEFKNVSRVYKSGDHELKALDGVNMSLEEGKFVVILGPSGA